MAVTTAWEFAGSATNVTVSVMTFTSTANTLDEDDDTATSGAVTSKNAEAYVRLENFGFDSVIPTGAIIDSVNARARGSASTGGSAHQLIPYLSTTAGTAVNLTIDGTLNTATGTAIGRPGGGTWARADLLDGTLIMRLRSLQPNNTTSRTYQWAYGEFQVVYSMPPKDHTSDVLVQATGSQTHTTDVLVQQTLTGTHTSDVPVYTTPTVEHTTDVQVGSGSLTQSHTTDVRVVGWETPLNLTATPVSNSQINLAWTATPTAIGYHVERDSVQIAFTTDNFFNDTGLASGTTYSYRVRALR